MDLELSFWRTRRPVAFWAQTLLVALLSIAAVRPAMALDPLLGLRVGELIAGGSNTQAIALLDTAIATETDPRITSDLLRQKAGLLERTGRHAEAATAWLDLAAAIGKDGGETSPELIPVLSAAARQFEFAGDLPAALSALERLLKVVVTAGLVEQAQPFLDRVVELAAGTRDPAAKTKADGIALAYAEASRALGESERTFEIDPEKEYSTVKIYYATDRMRTGSELPNDFYSGERGKMEMGTAKVSIPKDHKPGKIEEPTVWTFDFREDPERHIVLSSVKPDADATVFAEMQAQIAESGSKEAFVFVHGFNVPFHEAAKRTAQMAFDMNFDGLPILFSWPSRASVLSYISDTAVVNLSGRRLSKFLDDIVAKSGATRIHLVAHSMGNRAMTDALELFALRHKGEPPAFDQVLFTAPDLDAGLFAEMMRTIRPAARRITLYASNADWALAISRQLHGDAARAGQGGESILHLAEVDSVDMTAIGDDMLAHSYYANNPSALSDMLALFWRDAPPENRCGMTRSEGSNGVYWQYSADSCDTGALLSTLSYLRRSSIATIADARQFMNRFIMPATIDPAERSRLEKALSGLFRK